MFVPLLLSCLVILALRIPAAPGIECQGGTRAGFPGPVGVFYAGQAMAIAPISGVRRVGVRNGLFAA